MEDLPQELAARRQSILERVTKRGRRLRRRRIAATTALVVLAVSVPLAAVAVSLDGDNGTHSIQTLAPSTTQSPESSTTATSSTTPIATTTTGAAAPTTTVATAPPVEPTTTPTTGAPNETTTTEIDCHNTNDPACGPLRYEPPLVNKPEKLVLVKVDQQSTPQGERVTFTLHASDPDSRLIPEPDRCGFQFSFGDGTREGCQAACASGPQFGTWDAPPAHPSDETYTTHHVYTQTGTFSVTLTVIGDMCGPRRSEASVSTTVHIPS